MPIPWPALGNALTLVNLAVEATGRLLGTTRKGRAAEAEVSDKLTSQAQGLKTLDDRVVVLEARVTEVERAALASSEILQSLAKQNYEAAQALAALRRRWLALAWGLGATAAIGLGLLAWLLVTDR